MKNINVIFEDHEFKKLLRVKKDLSWRKFILKLSKPCSIEKKENCESCTPFKPNSIDSLFINKKKGDTNEKRNVNTT